MKEAVIAPTGTRLGNPDLGPERQKGWDAGVDVAFGSHGSLGVTYYDQVADDLIQSVDLQPAPQRVIQFQNVGRVKNTGVEVEGAVLVGPLQLKAQYGYSRSRVTQLAPNYTGDLRIGDQVLAIPQHTAGAFMAVTLWQRTTIVAGLTYVGSWSNYDYLAQFSCLGGTGPCAPTNRGYIVTYPDFAKVNVSVSHTLTKLLTGFVAVDNLTNNHAYEIGNLNPVMGRIGTAGLQLQY